MSCDCIREWKSRYSQGRQRYQYAKKVILDPCIIDSNMHNIKIKWNHNGSVLAISGTQFTATPQGEEKELATVQLYDPFGTHLRSLKIPNKAITSMAWSSDGLRMAFACDSFVYFANIKMDYTWSYFGDVAVYSYIDPDTNDSIITFWNSKTGEKFTKTFKKVSSILGFGESCLVIVKTEENKDKHALIVFNAIGTTLETKYIDLDPKYSAITKSHVYVASSDIVFYWQYRSLSTSKNSALECTPMFYP